MTEKTPGPDPGAHLRDRSGGSSSTRTPPASASGSARRSRFRMRSASRWRRFGAWRAPSPSTRSRLR